MYSAVYCTVLYCTVYSAVYCTLLYCIERSVLYSTVLCIVQCIVLYCTVLYCTVLYSTVLYRAQCTGVMTFGLILIPANKSFLREARDDERGGKPGKYIEITLGNGNRTDLIVSSVELQVVEWSLVWWSTCRQLGTA